MEYFIFIRKIKIYSLLSAIVPITALLSCLLLYSNIEKLEAFPSYTNWEEETPYVKWEDFEKYDTKKNTFTNCSTTKLAEEYIVLKDGTKILLVKNQQESHLRNKKEVNEENINKDEIYEKHKANNNIKGFFWTKSSNIFYRCVKNRPLYNKILTTFPFIENLLLDAKFNNKSGFSNIKNPFLYGEISISRSARYYPATLIFKPLIILTSIFLILYWKNNYNILKKLNEKLKKTYKKILFFGFLSAFFLFLHAVFLGIQFENDFYKLFRRVVIILFIIFEVTAQILLTKSLYVNQNYLKDLIEMVFIKIKIAFNVLIFFITMYAFFVLVFLNPSTEFKNILEWNYFVFLLLYYVLSFLLWNKKKPRAHTPEGV